MIRTIRNIEFKAMHCHIGSITKTKNSFKVGKFRKISKVSGFASEIPMKYLSNQIVR